METVNAGLAVVGSIFLIARVIVKLTPTKKDDKILSIITAVAKGILGQGKAKDKEDEDEVNPSRR